MSNGKDVDKEKLRLFKLATKVHTLVLEDKRDPESALKILNDAYQRILEMSQVTQTVSEYITLDPKFFRLIKSFTLTVPINYIPETQLMHFKYKYRNDFHTFDNEITDENFSKVNHQLIPGKTYVVHIVGIMGDRTVSLSDCLKAYQTLGAYYTGAQGLALAWEFEKERFFDDSRLFSFSGSRLTPSISRVCTSICKIWWFKVDIAEDIYFYHNDYLLCLCDLK